MEAPSGLMRPKPPPTEGVNELPIGGTPRDSELPIGGSAGVKELPIGGNVFIDGAYAVVVLPGM